MELVDKLYDTIGQEGFAAVPALLAEAGGARSCSFQVIGADRTPEVVESSYFSAEMNRFYVAHEIYRHDIWQVRTRHVAPGRALDLLRHVSRNEYLASRFYQDMIRHFGDDTGRCIGILLPAYENKIIGVGLHRALGDRAFDAANVAALDVLRPHLQRVVAAQVRFHEAETTGAAWETALAAMPQPAMVVGPKGSLAFANRRAEAVLKRGDGITVVEGRLCLAWPKEQEQLARCLHEALTRRGSRGGALLVSRTGGTKPYSAVIQPLAAGERTLALVLISDPDEDGADRAGLLRQLYRLTPAEADVATMVAAGSAIEQVAENRRVTVATAKTLLQRAYQKTEVSKASELARLVARLPA